MIAIVLIGVMLDRPVLTLRTMTIAALLVLLFAPEAVVHPSFQMSFAATLALIAAYDARPAAGAGGHGFLARRARRACGASTRSSSLVIASLVAGLATTPYAAFHFHRIAPYGVLANLLAMPVVSALGDADGHSRRRRHAVRLRRAFSGGRWATASNGWTRSHYGWRACPAPSAG